MSENENYTPELLKEIDGIVKNFHKLLKSAGDPEFIQMQKHNVWLAGSKIEIKDNWYKATNKYIDHNIVVEPAYYFDLHPLLSDPKSWEKKDSETPNSFEYIYIDWQEGETIGSGMLTLTSKQYREFCYGKLNKMFLQFLKKTYKDSQPTDWWKEEHDKFLADDKAIIHIIILVHDQDTTANIRHFEYDTPEGENVCRAMRFLTERTTIGDILNLGWY